MQQKCIHLCVLFILVLNRTLQFKVVCAKGRVCFLRWLKGFRYGWFQAHSQCHQNSEVFALLSWGLHPQTSFSLHTGKSYKQFQVWNLLSHQAPQKLFNSSNEKKKTAIEFQQLWLSFLGSLAYLILKQCLGEPGLVSSPFDSCGMRRKEGSTGKLGCCCESLSEWLLGRYGYLLHSLLERNRERGIWGFDSNDAKSRPGVKVYEILTYKRNCIAFSYTVQRSNKSEEGLKNSRKISCEVLLASLRLSRTELHLYTIHCAGEGKVHAKGINGYCTAHSLPSQQTSQMYLFLITILGVRK